MPYSTEPAAREARLRRAANRKGLLVLKLSQRDDPHQLGARLFAIVEPRMLVSLEDAERTILPASPVAARRRGRPRKTQAVE